jgi:tetratricopeptide (TPR) repeat protein
MARFSILTFALIAQVTLLYAEDTDVIERTDGKPIPPLTITHDDYLHVIGKHVIEYKVPAYVVKDVAYGGGDADFVVGMQRLREERYTVAARCFKTALDAAGDKKWAIELYNYSIGNALFLNGSFGGYKGQRFDYEAPANYFKRAVDANPKSRYLLDIVAKLPVCVAGTGDFDGASEAFKDAEKRIAAYETETAATHDPLYAPAAKRARAALSISLARVQQMKAETKKGDWKTACDAWHDAAQKTAAFAELVPAAQRGWLNALVESQEIDAAKEKATEIIEKQAKEPDSRQWSLLGFAHFIQGRIAYLEALDAEKAGRALQATRGFADARWSFVNAAVYALEGTEGAKAQLLAGKCCEKLKSVEEDGAEKAVRYWKEVLRSNPEGEVADAARAELKAHAP